MEAVLNYTLFSNSIFDYIVGILIFLSICIAAKIVNWIIVKKLKQLAKKTATSVDDFLVEVMEKLAVPFLYLVAFYVGLKSLTLSAYLNRGLNILAMASLTFFFVRLAIRIITYCFEVYGRKSQRGAALKYSLSGMLRVIKFLIWTLAIIFYLDNLGFKISTVVAGLGIGGIALALAAQAILGDLFSYFSIIIDRPFEIGDFVIIGDLLGTIEHIGIKTTRIRSLGGEQLVFSNSDLTGSRLRNYKRMQKRRIVFHLGTTYNTPLSKLKEIPAVIEKAIKKVKATVFDRAHFASYGDFSLNFEIVYYVLSNDYNKYMDIQQEINFSIKQVFEERKIEFAFPTQTIHMAK